VGFLEDAFAFVDGIVTAPSKVFGTEREPWQLMQVIKDGVTMWHLSDGVDSVMCSSREVAVEIKRLFDKERG